MRDAHHHADDDNFSLIDWPEHPVTDRPQREDGGAEGEVPKSYCLFSKKKENQSGEEKAIVFLSILL